MQQQQECMVVIRSRYARTAWEKLCKCVVGDPVHMDIVLAKPGSHSARFCFSAYMQQTFDMVLMDEGLVMDESMQNHCINVSDEEFGRCMEYMQNLVNARTKYDYADALVIMPATKMFWPLSFFTEDVENMDFQKKVFCSQSVVLMLRKCLDASGRHHKLVNWLNATNSRLASPKLVLGILLEHSETKSISNEELARLSIFKK